MSTSDDFLSVYTEQQLQKREEEFVERVGVNVLCATWNVNGKMPSEALHAWLLSAAPDGPQQAVDIYAIGFQELDLTAGALLLGDETRAGPWESHLRATLNGAASATGTGTGAVTASSNGTGSDKFELLVSKQLVGMLLCVFVRRDLLPHVRDVATDVEPVGIMGIMGNKGGVAVRFVVHDSSVCIVNCHLNAHHANVRRRNQDYRDICDRLRFVLPPNAAGAASPGAGAPPGTASAANGGTTASGAAGDAFVAGESTLWDHEHLFWIGDLNYRIDLPDDHVRTLTARGAWDELYAADQLRAQQRGGFAFHGWQEAPIRFAPTYKYDTDSENYDTSEKRRAPAWCDRVLYRGATIGSPCVQQLWYKRHELRSSDHRPVSALFTVQAKRVVAEKRSAVLRDIVETLARFENDARPDCQLSPQQWDLEPVRFGVEQSRQLVLRNNGPGVAQFSFVARPGADSPIPAWLRATPPRGLVAPNTECVISLTALVDGALGSQLDMCESDAARSLSDILVLHLEHGLDFFVSISGTYQVSAFGCSLEYLVCCAAPVRAAAPRPAAAAATANDRLLVPKELWLLVDRLQRDGLDEASLFQQSGDAAVVMQVRDWLDTHEDFAAVSADVSVHSIAETLLRLLGSLAQPVVPFEHYFEALDAADTPTRCRTLLQYVPLVHFRTFHYIAALLRTRVVARRHDSGDAAAQREAARLAALFGPVMIRPSTRSRPSTQAMYRSALFVAQFILPPDLSAAGLRLEMLDEIETD